MHSYLRNDDDTYSIGLWLATGDDRGCTFNKLFDVIKLSETLRIVNVLNGGSGKPHWPFLIVKEH